MILSSQEIDAAMRAGQIVIDPRPDEAAWTSTANDMMPRPRSTLIVGEQNHRIARSRKPPR